MFNDVNILNYQNNFRQKIAQQTFDMVSGGSVYNPVVTNINTVNEVPTFAVGVGFTVPTHPSEYEINAIDMLYGSRISTQQQPLNTIDSLYRKGEEVQSWQRPPCWQNSNLKDIRYPDQFLINTYITDYVLNFDCSVDISFIIPSKLYSMGFQNVTIPISLGDCCESFKKNLFCAVNEELLGHAFDDFKTCVELQIGNTVNQFMLDNPDILQPISFPTDFMYEDPWKAIIRQTEKIKEAIDSSKKIYLDPSNNDKNHYTGYDSLNSKSCLCGGTEPTYCCDPQSHPECLDEFGRPKNLCDFRKKIEKIIVDNKGEIDEIWNGQNDTLEFFGRVSGKNIFQPYKGGNVTNWIEHFNQNGFVIGLPIGSGTWDLKELVQGFLLTHHDNSYFKLEEIWLLFLYYLDWFQKYPNKNPPSEFFIMLRREDSIDVVVVSDYIKFFDSVIINILKKDKETILKTVKENNDWKELIKEFVTNLKNILNNDITEVNLSMFFRNLGLTFYKLNR